MWNDGGAECMYTWCFRQVPGYTRG